MTLVEVLKCFGPGSKIYVVRLDYGDQDLPNCDMITICDNQRPGLGNRYKTDGQIGLPCHFGGVVEKYKEEHTEYAKVTVYID